MLVFSVLKLRRASSLSFVTARTLRTLRAVRPVQDLDSQLSGHPPEVRQLLLDKLQAHADQPGENSPDKQHTTLRRPDLQGVDYNAAIVSAYLSEVESVNQLDLPFWQTVRSLARSATAQKTPEYLQLFSMLFEAAKSIESPSLRQSMIYEIGRYIYRQKQVRLDPVNEVEFLDSLVANKRAFTALGLWKMRRGREEVQNSSYWDEMGVLFYLDAGLVARANQLGLELQNPSGRIVAALIGAWSYLSRKNRFVADSSRWLEYWTRVFEENMPGFSHDDFHHSLAALLRSRHWDLAKNLVAKSPRAGIDLDTSVIIDALNQSSFSRVNEKYPERDFVALFEQLLTVGGPELATHGSLAASLALSLARQGDKETALGLLEELGMRKASIAPNFQSQLARSLIDRASEWPEILRQSSVAVLVGLRSERWDLETKRSKWEYFRSNPSDSLAVEAMRQNVLSASEMLNLALTRGSSNIWTQLWYLVASEKISVCDLMGEPSSDATSLLNLMLNSGKSSLTAMQLVYIVHSVPVAQLLPVLQKHDDKPALDNLLAKLFVKTVKSATKGRRPVVRKPTFGFVNQANPQYTWGEIVKRIGAQ